MIRLPIPFTDYDKPVAHSEVERMLRELRARHRERDQKFEEFARKLLKVKE